MKAIRFIQKTGAPDFHLVVPCLLKQLVLTDLPGSELTEEAPTREFINTNRLFKLSENILTGERSYVER